MTPAQERAVYHHKGACLVLAGPGSGKTFVITGRLVHMVRKLHIPGEHILVITFTRAAALEMEARFKKICPEAQPWFGTFHSCFYYILRNSFSSIPARFISPEEKQHILRDICTDLWGKECDIEIEDVERHLSLFMNNGLTMSQNQKQGDFSPEHLRQIYGAYHKALVEYQCMDFDDLMLCCYQALKDNPELKKRWQEQFQYILIDECQDMNVLQYEIIKLLTGPERNVFMVGDDDQSVYRFRGAKVELMQRFLEEYKPVTQVHLDMNFRSRPEIVEKSLKVISQNKNRFVKKMTAQERKTSEYTGSVHIQSFELRHDMYERTFEGLLKGDISSFEHSAIIYRTNRELRNMAYKLRKKNIPYVAAEDKKSIFDEEWYLDMEAYMRLGLGSLDRQYVLRAANKPNRFIRRDQLVHLTVLPEPLACAVKHIGTMRPFLAMKYIWSGIGYSRWLERELAMNTEEFDVICEQYEEICQEMKVFSSIEDWLEHTRQDRRKQREHQNASSGEEKQGVHLITMHASKGLEFDTVYLLDVNKGKVPKGSKLTSEELEEERRLFYVAMTRARNDLYIYYVKGGGDHVMQPSVFLEPIL